ncbi:MAG: DUF3662 and FHA domain-containing protein [Patulibacter sp.]
MALLRNLEQSLSGLVEGTVGRVFRTEVRPTEIARKLAREMEINKRVSLSRTYAPTDYIVYLSLEDRARYAGVEPSIAEELGAYLLEHARRERLVLVRRPLVEFRTDQRLRLGEFGIEARTAPISAAEAPSRPESAPPIADPSSAVALPGPELAPAPAPGPAPDPELGGELEAELYDEPEPDPDSGPDQHGAVPPRGDWLDPVDDWEAPAQPSSPVAPPGVGAPWIDPAGQNPSALPHAAPPRPPLVLSIDGRRCELDGDYAVIGRSRKSDVVISDPSVSRRHVELRRDEDGWYALDLGSTNGTLLNGQPLTAPQRLAPGSRLEVGHAPAVIEVG